MAIVLLAAVLSTSPARAEAPSACPIERPSDVEVSRRLAWIERQLAEAEDGVRLWFTGFVALQAMLVGVQLARLAAASTDQERIDPIVSGLGSALGLSTLLIGMPPILGAGDALRSLPRASREERHGALRIAEARLAASAAASSEVRGDISALASILYTEAAALTLLFLGQVRDAFFQAGGGILIGLGRIALHPSGAIRAWSTYRAHHEDAGCLEPPTERAPRSTILPAASRDAAGLALTITF